MKIACVQTDIRLAQFAANQQTLCDRLETAAAGGADLVVFPECMLSGYAYESRREATENSLEIGDSRIDDIAHRASRLGVHATFGFLEKSGDRLFNAAVMVGPSGLCGHYRKVHLPALGVDRFVDRGDLPYGAFPAASANASESPARIGLAICYDCSFPEPMRLLGLEGADVIALGTNWPVAAARTAEIVPPARSMENHLYFVAANRIGTERGFTFCGKSSICGPDGVVCASTDGDEATILYADVDLQVARNKTIERTPGAHVIDRFADRQPDRYGRLVDPV